MTGRPPAVRASTSGVRLSVETKDRFAAEGIVGVVERLSVTETDDRMKDGAQSLLGAQVCDGPHQVAVGMQQTEEVSVPTACTDFAAQPSEHGVDDVGVELDLVPEIGDAWLDGLSVVVKDGYEEVWRSKHVASFAVLTARRPEG